jgi:hypothetical protein
VSSWRELVSLSNHSHQPPPWIEGPAVHIRILDGNRQRLPKRFCRTLFAGAFLASGISAQPSEASRQS